jgi:hypothetical protein
MKIIKYFKLFESRSSELSQTEFEKILKDNCKDFLNNPKLLQRDKKKFDSKYSYINPKKFTREPLMMSDGDVLFSNGVSSRHHTLLMKNLPSWNKFPKRSKSIIGSTALSTSTCFGKHSYFVIPFDGATFGLTPRSDLWTTWIELPNLVNGYYVEPKEFSFDALFSEIMLKGGISDESYNEMISDLQTKFNEFKIDEDKRYFKGALRGLDIIFKNMKSDNIDNVSIAFDRYFNPSNFKTSLINPNSFEFEVVSYDELTSDSIREFWTESECLFVYAGVCESHIDLVFNKFIKDLLKESQD